MRLDQTLVVRGLCESRTEAQELIESGFVLVNGVVNKKQAKSILEEDIIELMARRKYVSRGGEKLEGVFQDVFKYKREFLVRQMSNVLQSSETPARGTLVEQGYPLLDGILALDIGSSTGGFTDCLLQFGVSHVDAVDVGTEQLHVKLRNDPRISLFENTDIREFKTDILYDLVVADLSFISLEAVLDTILAFGKTDAEFFLLLKPQFEVGKGNTKKGIVKDGDLVSKVLKRYENAAKSKGLRSVSIFPCHIQGGDGNQEFFLVGSKQ